MDYGKETATNKLLQLKGSQMKFDDDTIYGV